MVNLTKNDCTFNGILKLRFKFTRIPRFWKFKSLIALQSTVLRKLWPQYPFSTTWLFFCAGCIQLIQFNYQNGTLYKLRALGGGHSLHITVGAWYHSCVLRDEWFVFFFTSCFLFQMDSCPGCGIDYPLFYLSYSSAIYSNSTMQSLCTRYRSKNIARSGRLLIFFVSFRIRKRNMSEKKKYTITSHHN